MLILIDGIELVKAEAFIMYFFHDLLEVIIIGAWFLVEEVKIERHVDKLISLWYKYKI